MCYRKVKFAVAYHDSLFALIVPCTHYVQRAELDPCHACENFHKVLAVTPVSASF